VRLFKFYLITLLIPVTFIAIADRTLPLFEDVERPDYTSPGLFVNHGYRGFELAKNFEGWYVRHDFSNKIHIDEHGNHDTPLRPNASKRIVAIGGSFTAGLEVPEQLTWPALLEKRLGPNWDVINYGRPGRHFSYFADLLNDQFFHDIKPDFIVAGFSHARFGPSYPIIKGKETCVKVLDYKGFSFNLHGEEGPEGVRKLIDQLRTYFPFNLYNTFTWLHKSNLFNLLIQFQTERFKKDNPEYAKASIRGNRVNFGYQCSQNKPTEENTFQSIATIREQSKKHDVPVLFFFLPAKWVYLHNADSHVGKISYYFLKGDYAYETSDDFKKDYDKRKVMLHWDKDGHPNREGYKLISEIISKRFTEFLKSLNPSNNESK
jgi:lysophospholipase L1-like esterase